MFNILFLIVFVASNLPPNPVSIKQKSAFVLAKLSRATAVVSSKNVIFSLFNTLLTILTYTIVPFFYPDIIASIFKCNVKYLIIVFGISILGTLWYYQDKKNGIDFGLTNEILGWMTVTFVVISIFTIISQK